MKTNSLKPYYLLKSGLFLFSFLVVFLISCDEETIPPILDSESENPTDEGPQDQKTPKYIFFFIGDGMGTPQVNIAEAAIFDDNFRLMKSASVGTGSVNLQRFTSLGMQTTHAEDRYITGSAAAATALSCGHKTTINTISMNGNHSKSYKTMAEMAKEKGMRVGIVSSVSIDHATPACFYAHSDTRNWYNYIAAQMDDSGFDYFGGGFAKGNFDKYKDNSKAGKRMPSDFSPVDIIDEMKAAGYQIAVNKTELKGITNGMKCWAYSENFDGSGALPYEIDRDEEDLSLADFTEKGIELLENEKGFFLMVEGGKIDWACHANDVVSATHDMIAFDDAIGKALEFYDAHPDETLIVVTGDHECGGMTLGHAATGYKTAFTLLNYQTISYERFMADIIKYWPDNISFEEAMGDVKTYFGLGDETIKNTSAQGDVVSMVLSEDENIRLRTAFEMTMDHDDPRYDDASSAVSYGSYDPFTVTITHILNQKAGIDWNSYKHTGVPVPVFAIGAGSDLFDGYYDNTDVAKKIIAAGELAK